MNDLQFVNDLQGVMREYGGERGGTGEAEAEKPEAKSPKPRQDAPLPIRLR